MKKIMKKENVVDTAIALALGGGANVAFDYISNVTGLDETVGDDRIMNAIKLVGGAIGSAMVSNRIAKDALNGVAVVGASNLIKSFMGTSSSENGNGNGDGADGGSAGVPIDTVGRLLTARAPRKNYAREVKQNINGVPAGTFMS